ncbi:hypothetical protein B0H13DRAFT_1881828 [Mycena leptocephala]|nr:hypothetical protein B0H13DRAFT_1881828 [Mycena leptocephala]
MQQSPHTSASLIRSTVTQCCCQISHDSQHSSTISLPIIVGCVLPRPPTRSFRAITDGNLVLSVTARSQLISLVAQDWAVRATLVMYAKVVSSIHTLRHPRGPRTTIVRPCAHLALWILFKALHAFFPAYTYSFCGLSISARELPNLEDAKKKVCIERGIYGQRRAYEQPK